tara:strand:+ start:25 stop:369 length:345 start_codon:yes stop_codon:yes gene_type:complete
MTSTLKNQGITICRLSDLIANSGICADVSGQQVALFYLPDESPCVYAIGNWDPIGKANVLSRGMVGDIGGRLIVASPLYKQHFDLITGECLENSDVSVPVYTVELVADHVLLKQ